MFDGHWVPEEGTVVDRRIKDSKWSGGTSTSVLFEYIVDVRPTEGAAFRALVQPPKMATDFSQPEVGQQVKVEVHSDGQKVRFDKSDPGLSIKASKRARKQRFDETLDADPGSQPG